MMLGSLNGKRILATPNIVGVTCPYCDEEVIPKCGRIKIWHWAHKTKENCDNWSEGETEWHLNWKSQFPEDWREVIIIEDNIKHIADIKTNRGKVIELQNSPLSLGDLEKRELFYKDMVWVLNSGTLGKNLELTRNPKGFYSFQWKWFPKGWAKSKKQLFVDLEPKAQVLLERYKAFCKENPGNGVVEHRVRSTYTYDYYYEGEPQTGYGSDYSTYYTSIEDEKKNKLKEYEMYHNKVLEIRRIYTSNGARGWGNLIDKEEFLKKYLPQEIEGLQ